MKIKRRQVDDEFDLGPVYTREKLRELDAEHEQTLTMLPAFARAWRAKSTAMLIEDREALRLARGQKEDPRTRMSRALGESRREAERARSDEIDVAYAVLWFRMRRKCDVDALEYVIDEDNEFDEFDEDDYA